MNFENRVEATRRYLTTSEKKIANYILGHPKAAAKMSINELAKASRTSAATVSRLVKSLQLESYTAMKVMLSVDLAQQKDQDADKKMDISAHDSFAQICNKLVNNEIENLNHTKEFLQEGICQGVVARLLKSKTIYVFGVGASLLAAQNIYQKWSRIGCHVICEEDINVLLPQLSNATAADTLWLISNSGETPECIYLADYARKHHLFTISLTMFGQNSLVKRADLALTTCKPIEPDVRVGATNSITGQFYIIDVLFYLYFSRNFDQSIKAVTKSRQEIENYRKIFRNK